MSSMQQTIAASVAEATSSTPTSSLQNREPKVCLQCGSKAIYKVGKYGFCSNHRYDAKKIAARARAAEIRKQ